MNTINKIIAVIIVFVGLTFAGLIVSGNISLWSEESSMIQKREKDYQEKFGSPATSTKQLPEDSVDRIFPPGVPYKVGDKFGNFTVASIEPLFKNRPDPIHIDNARIVLQGEARITGSYSVEEQWNDPEWLEVDFHPNSSEQLLDGRSFRLSGEDALLAVFLNGSKKEGTAVINIKNIIINMCGCDAVGTWTTVTEIFEIE